MPNNITPPNCEVCDAQLVKKEKDDKTFYTCPNWKPNNAGCKGMIWFPPSIKKKGSSVRKEYDQGEKIVEGLRSLWEKLDEILAELKGQKL